MLMKKWVVWVMWGTMLLIQIAFGIAIEKRLDDLRKGQEETIDVFTNLSRKQYDSPMQYQSDLRRIIY